MKGYPEEVVDGQSVKRVVIEMHVGKKGKFEGARREGRVS